MKSEPIYPSTADRSFKIFVLVLVGGIFAVLGGLALAAHLTSRQKDENELEPMPSGSMRGALEQAFKCTSTTYPLQFGTCHPDVKILQRHLKKLGALLGDTGKSQDGVDGRFGAKTQTAAKKYLTKEIFTTLDIQKLNA